MQNRGTKIALKSYEKNLKICEKMHGIKMGIKTTLDNESQCLNKTREIGLFQADMPI